MLKRITALMAMLLFAASLQAQVVVRSIPIYTGKTFAVSAGDSSHAVIPLAYNGTDFAIAPNQLPDSITYESYSSGDSTSSFKIRFKAGVSGSGIYTTTLIDSLQSASVAAVQGVGTVTKSLYNGYDVINFAIRNVVAGGGAPPSTISKLTLVAKLYYTFRSYRP